MKTGRATVNKAIVMERTTRNPNTAMPRKSVKPLRQLKKPELLAPAGGLPAFFAAMEAGANAVYCGLENFSARAKAQLKSSYSLTYSVELSPR